MLNLEEIKLEYLKIKYHSKCLASYLSLIMMIMIFPIQKIHCYSSVTEFERNQNITWLYKKSLLFDWLDQQLKIGKDINAKLLKGMHI